MGVNKKTRRNRKSKTPAGEPQSIVVQNIEVRPIHRKKQNIPDWRAAIQSAEAQNPRLWQLYSLYYDVALDAKVIAVTGKRFDAVTTANWQFVNKDGEAVDIINDIIDSIGFETIVREILNAKFWGYSIFEPKFYKAHDNNWEVVANLLPRLHYRPQKGIISYDGISDEGINIREGIYAKTVMEIGDPKDLGLFAAAAQYQVLKRGGIGDYAMFVQVFGRPIIDATYDGTDDTQKQKLKMDLDVGAGGVIVRPDGTTLNILESKGTQSTIHSDFKKDMNDEIALALLGSTETTESSDSSGYAQAETHGEADAKKTAGDINYVRRYLNSRFVKILEAHGIETEGGKFIVDDSKSVSKKEKLETLVTAKREFGLPIDDDDVYEITGIPKPEDYDAQKAAQQEHKNDQLESPEATKNTKTKEGVKTKESKKTKDNEDEKEVKLMAKWWEGFKQLFLTAPAKVGATNGKHPLINLTFKNTFNNDEFIQRVYDAKGKLDFDADFFKSNLKVLLNAFKTGWNKELVTLNGGLGFEYNFNDPAMLTAFELNLFRFAGAKDLALVQRLNELFRQSSSYAEFYKLASAETKIFNQDYLQTEYNTALLTGEAAATYHRLKAITHIYPYWEYVTANDEHVRHSHKPLHGIILSANDARWDKLFPPNGWNCRCYIRPLMKDQFTGSLAKHQAKADAYLNSPAYAKEAAQGWGVNRGKIGEIFTANQQYVNKFQNNSSAILNELTPVKWGLKQYSNAKKAATENAPINQSTIDAVVNDLNDYNQRILKVDETLFSDSNKMDLLDAMQEAIQNPHEVWVQNSEVQSLIYLHYFKDKTLAVKAILKDLELTIDSVEDLENNKDLIKQFRKGLLAKQ